MKINVLNFVKILNICIFLYLIYSFVGILDKGFDHADESFHLLSSINPTDVKFFFSYFHFITFLIHKVSLENILNARIIILIILLFSSNYFVLSFFKKYFHKDFVDEFYSQIIIIASSISIFYYYTNTYYPSYNILNLIFILILFGFLVNYFEKSFFSYISIIGISTFFFLILINKVTTGILISFLIFVFFYRSAFFIKNILIFFLICFFFLLILFFNENISYIYNLISNFLNNKNDSFGFLQSHNLITLLEKNFNIVFKKVISYKFSLIYLSFLFITLINKKNYNFYIIIFIFLKNIFSGSFVVWLDVIYLAFYNLILFRNKKNIVLAKKNLKIIILMIYLTFAYYFGTNIEINRFFIQSSIFAYTSLILIFFLNIDIKFIKYREFFFSFLVFVILICTFNVVSHINKYEFFTNKSKNENIVHVDSYYNERLFSNIKIRKKLKQFNDRFEFLLKENQWDSNDMLIDATLKHPGILLIANSKFIESPWYFHSSQKLKSSLKNYKLKKAPWFIVVSTNQKNKKIVFDHFKNTRFEFIGQLTHPYSKKLIDLYKPYDN